MGKRLENEEYHKMKQEYFRGWKTWNVNSVLSYVHMPDGLTMKLSVKEYQSGRYLPDALIGQFPDPDGQTEREILYPGDHATDDSYTSMRVEWCGLEFQVETASEEDHYYILVTPVKQQIRPALLILEAGYLWNRPGRVERDVAELSGEQPGMCGRPTIAYRIGCTGLVYDHDLNLPCMNPYLSVKLDRETAFWAEKSGSENKAEKSLEEIRKIVHQKRHALHAGHRKYGKQDWMVQAMECAIAWDTIYDPGHMRVISPVSRLWSIRSGGYVLFCWDNYFAAYLAAVCGCREQAYSNLIEITSERTAKGFVPNFTYGTGQKSGDRSQPPVGSFMLWKVYQIYQEKWIVRLLFPALLEWNTWFWTHRKAPSGALCWGSDPIPVRYGNIWETAGVHDRYGAALESGLDNSPMYDDIPFDPETNMLQLEDVGLTGLFIQDCAALLQLAAILGITDCAEEIRHRKEEAELALEGLWDEEFGFYCNRRIDTGEYSHRISPTNFYALYSDRVRPEQIQRILKEHYYNENEFYGEWMLPSIARSDPAFQDQDYWRGRVWAPLNFLTYLALKKQGCKEACADLAEKSCHIFRKEWEEHLHVHENYNAITGEGCDVTGSDKFYHWGALMAVIALMETDPDL